ncbi:DUF2931 family protein [Erwinia rhapontici]|uniref:DUF2931 family protein n=1 Tax=Erwinia rhapontici TaxID=55212 RepID=UPI0021689F3C|nr:DUF2931 family protein [Erwinia rhapontici]MCS3606176.1 hypothetical protein [Erwinia rhapontici]
MEIKRIAGLLSLLILTACQGAGEPNKATQNTEPKEWKFNFFTPKALPALVTFVVVQDAAGTVYQFNTLNSTPDMDDVIDEWNDSSRAPGGHWNHVEKPPKHIIFCWDSVIDKKVYETHLTLSDEIVDKMRKPSPHKYYQGKTRYHDSIQIGLAPEGKVAVWVNGIGFEHNYRITPSVLKTLYGDKLDICKGITKSDFSYGYDEDIKDFIKGKKYPYGKW